jgi:hypothetical protein
MSNNESFEIFGKDFYSQWYYGTLNDGKPSYYVDARGDTFTNLNIDKQKNYRITYQKRFLYCGVEPVDQFLVEEI